jgi:hypothetical protein
VEQQHRARAHAVGQADARHPGQDAVQAQAERPDADQAVGQTLDGFGVTPGLVRLVRWLAGPSSTT